MGPVHGQGVVTRPRLLDLFCCAGGAAMGYHRAGFDVVGVDINPQPNYPFEFHQADAMTFPLEGFDAIHASPPCQHYSVATKWRGDPTSHPDLLQPTIDRLSAHGAPFVVENVPGAPMAADLMLCGSMFGLKVRRHRLFMVRPTIAWMTPPCHHVGLLPFMHKGERAYADALGVPWMSSIEGRQAIPPAYSEFIGTQLLAHLTARVEVPVRWCLTHGSAALCSHPYDETTQCLEAIYTHLAKPCPLTPPLSYEQPEGEPTE